LIGREPRRRGIRGSRLRITAARRATFCSCSCDRYVANGLVLSCLRGTP
jgi:hypothetical protein